MFAPPAARPLCQEEIACPTGQTKKLRHRTVKSSEAEVQRSASSPILNHAHCQPLHSRQELSSWWSGRSLDLLSGTVVPGGALVDEMDNSWKVFSPCVAPGSHPFIAQAPSAASASPRAPEWVGLGWVYSACFGPSPEPEFRSLEKNQTCPSPWVTLGGADRWSNGLR